MSVPPDPDLPIIVAVVAGLFSLLGAFAGAFLAKRTEYEKWLRQAREQAFAEFLRQIYDVHAKAIDALYSVDISPQNRDIKITELFNGLSAQENIVRLYLKPSDREAFSKLKQEIWALYYPSVEQPYRMKKTTEHLKAIQTIFEQTVHG